MSNYHGATMFPVGVARQIAVTAAAKENSDQLPVGRYMLRCDADCHIVCGDNTAVAVATDMLLMANEVIYLDVIEGYLSIIRDAADGTAYIAGADAITCQAQPPAWA